MSIAAKDTCLKHEAGRSTDRSQYCVPASGAGAGAGVGEGAGAGAGAGAMGAMGGRPGRGARARHQCGTLVLAMLRLVRLQFSGLSRDWMRWTV